jgi:hypothetical protein
MITAINAIICLISILVLIRATFLVRRSRKIQNEIFKTILSLNSDLQKIIPKTIVSTLSILASNDVEAKAKLQKLIDERE